MSILPILLFPGSQVRIPKPALGVQFIDVRSQLPRHATNDPPNRSRFDIEFLVVHWDGTGTIDPNYDPIARYKWEAQFHIDKNWDDPPAVSHGGGLMYAIKIDRWGRAYLCRDAEAVLWHATRANVPGYAICVDATPLSPPTAEQFVTLKKVIQAKRAEFALPYGEVFGHGELGAYGNSTECPGPDALRWLRDYRAS